MVEWALEGGYLVHEVNVMGRRVKVGLDADLMALLSPERQEAARVEALERAFAEIRDSFGLGK